MVRLAKLEFLLLDVPAFETQWDMSSLDSRASKALIIKNHAWILAWSGRDDKAGRTLLFFEFVY